MNQLSRAARDRVANAGVRCACVSERLSHTFAVAVGLRHHPAFRRSPVRVAARAALWAAHCIVRRPATIELGSPSARLQLPPQFLHGGAGGVFVLREDYEPELRWIERVLADGMVGIDGGANLGIYTILFSRLVGASGAVLSFEPGAVSYRRLERNIALNAASNVLAMNKALSDHCGCARLYHTSAGPIGYSLARDTSVPSDYEEVATTTIDVAVDDAKLRRVDLIKLDIEGAEGAALRGARATLTRHRPMVLFEVHPQAAIRTGVSRHDAWDLLSDLGYELWGVTEAGDLRRRSAPRVGNNVALPP